MQQRGRFQQHVQLPQAAAGGLGTRHVVNARKQLGNRFLGGARGGTEYQLVGIFQPEGDRVAVIQHPAFHFFAVHEHPAPLPAIFEVIAVRFHHNRSAIPRDAAVCQLQMIAGFPRRGRSERAPRSRERTSALHREKSPREPLRFAPGVPSCPPSLLPHSGANCNTRLRASPLYLRPPQDPSTIPPPADEALSDSWPVFAPHNLSQRRQMRCRASS